VTIMISSLLHNLSSLDTSIIILINKSQSGTVLSLRGHLAIFEEVLVVTIAEGLLSNLLSTGQGRY
jgi:hypothetical protein